MAFWQYLHLDLKWTYNYDKSKNNVDARWRAVEKNLKKEKKRKAARVNQTQGWQPGVSIYMQ